MRTDLTESDLDAGAPLATEILTRLAASGAPPGAAIAALAMVLGRTCATFGFALAAVGGLLVESFRVGYASARQN